MYSINSIVNRSRTSSPVDAREGQQSPPQTPTSSNQNSAPVNRELGVLRSGSRAPMRPSTPAGETSGTIFHRPRTNDPETISGLDAQSAHRESHEPTFRTAADGAPLVPRGHMIDARGYADTAMRAGVPAEQAVEQALQQAAQRGTPLTHDEDLAALNEYVRMTAASGGPRVPRGYLITARNDARTAMRDGVSQEEAVQQGLGTAEAHFGYPMTNPADFEVLRQAINDPTMEASADNGFDAMAFGFRETLARLDAQAGQQALLAQSAYRRSPELISEPPPPMPHRWP